MKKTLLHLGAQHMHLASLQTASRLGLRVVAVDPDPKAPGRDLADRFETLDLADVPSLLSLARDTKACGVFTMAADFPVPALAAICAELGLPGPTPRAAMLCTDKARMREALEAESVPCPRSLSASDLSSFGSLVQDLSAPFIVKPAASSGGRGITCFTGPPTDRELEHAFNSAAGHSRSGEIVFEEAVTGPEFSIEAVTCGGLTSIVAVTDKLTSGPPFFVEIGHTQPSRFGSDELRLLEKTTLQTIQALGIDNAASHTEIVLTTDGPRVIESAARLGGGYINSRLVPLSSGIDIVAAAISIAVGDEPSLNPTHERGAAIRFFTPAPGRVERIEGLEHASIDGVEDLVLRVQPGDVVHTLSDSTTRVGYVIASGPDADAASRTAETARDSVEIHTQPQEASALPESE